MLQVYIINQYRHDDGSNEDNKAIPIELDPLGEGVCPPITVHNLHDSVIKSVYDVVQKKGENQEEDTDMNDIRLIYLTCTTPKPSTVLTEDKADTKDQKEVINPTHLSNPNADDAHTDTHTDTEVVIEVAVQNKEEEEEKEEVEEDAEGWSDMMPEIHFEFIPNDNSKDKASRNNNKQLNRQQQQEQELERKMKLMMSMLKLSILEDIPLLNRNKMKEWEMKRDNQSNAESTYKDQTSETTPEDPHPHPHPYHTTWHDLGFRPMLRSNVEQTGEAKRDGESNAKVEHNTSSSTSESTPSSTALSSEASTSTHQEYCVWILLRKARKY